MAPRASLLEATLSPPRNFLQSPLDERLAIVGRLMPNPAVNADVPGTCVLLVSRSGGTPVTFYR